MILVLWDVTLCSGVRYFCLFVTFHYSLFFWRFHDGFKKFFYLSVLRIINAMQQFSVSTLPQFFVTAGWFWILWNHHKHMPFQYGCCVSYRLTCYASLYWRRGKKPCCPPSILPPLTTLPLSAYFCFPSDRFRTNAGSDNQVINFSSGKSCTPGGIGGRRRGILVYH